MDYEAYVYLIKHIPSSFYYIRFRCKNITLKRNPEDDLWIKYFSSSKKIKELIQKYGKNTFEYSILYRNKDSKACFMYEQDLIRHHMSNRYCLNQYYKGSFTTTGLKHSEETKNKIREKAKCRVMSDEVRNKIKNTLSGRPKSAEHIAAAANGRRGKKNKNPAWNKGLKGLYQSANKNKKLPQYPCKYCNKNVSKTNLKRWHNDKCKSKPN